jgi:hypothetical protein
MLLTGAYPGLVYPGVQPCAAQDALLRRVAYDVWRTNAKPEQRIKAMKLYITKPA